MSNQDISYSSGHPWYYVLGGNVRSLKEIWQDVKYSSYRGYLEEEIKKLSGNNAKLRSMREDIISSLSKDVSRYRQCALELHRYRKQINDTKVEPVCENIHVSISLKRNHIYNDLAHLEYINNLMSYQLELF